MNPLDYPVELAAMAALVVASAFFSGSEAALFSISRSERTDMAGGAPGERRAASLLLQPERLLTVVLFWNLLVNLTYYALTEVVSVRIGRAEDASTWGATAFRISALMAVILLSEVLPKSLAVLKPRWLSALVSTPVGVAMRLVDPVLPSITATSNAVARLLLPQLRREPYMELTDLERAVEAQTGETLHNESLLIQERLVLQRLVELADTTAAELMRPRSRCLVMRPPVALADLAGRAQGVGEYVLFTEEESDEVIAATPLARLASGPTQRLEQAADPVSVVPWCASAAATLDKLREDGCRVAVVVNEFGETIGIVPLERVLDAVLRDSSRVDPHDAYAARLVQIPPDAWEATSGTPLRRVAKRVGEWLLNERNASTATALREECESARSRTVAGLLQERIGRPAILGDRILVGGLSWTVTSGSLDPEEEAPLLVRIEIDRSADELRGAAP